MVAHFLILKAIDALGDHFNLKLTLEDPLGRLCQDNQEGCETQKGNASAVEILGNHLLGPVAQRNQSATVRRSRSHVQIVPGPPIQEFLRSGRAGKARVSETRLRRFESYLRSQFEDF